jgi:DNA-directed RNA polymerase beta subunit
MSSGGSHDNDEIDINAMLADLGLNDNDHDNIVVDETNIDSELGAVDIGNALDIALSLDTVPDIMLEDSTSDDAITTSILNDALKTHVSGGVKKQDDKKHKAPERTPSIVYPAEEEGIIDPNITSAEMMNLIFAEIKRKKIAGHHIDSMNSFNRTGIKQIATKVFVIEGRLKNLRTGTDEDKSISEIQYKIEFTDIQLSPPTTYKYKSGLSQMLTPNMARIKNLTYSNQINIDATVTAIAHFKSGATKTRTAEIKGHRIGATPCQVGTELCSTNNLSKAGLKNIEEDPSAPGGSYIIKGGEWTIDNLENISNNTFHVYKNMWDKEIARGTFLSKPGDAFENSYQMIMRYLNTGAITIEITTNKFDKFEIPYYILFRALGMTRDRDIINHIVYGVENTDPVTVELLKILEKAFDVDDIKFGPIRKSTNPQEIITFIADKISEIAYANNPKKDDNVIKYVFNNILNIVDRYIFPHIGTGTEHRIKKLRFLGHLINRLLCVNLEVIDPTDRDSYKNKRIHAAGHSMSKTFKTHFNFAVVQETKKQLIKDFKNTPFSSVQLAEIVINSTKNDNLERQLTQSITSGSKTITVKRNEITNRTSAQTLYHKNDLNVTSTLNTINNSNTGGAGKQTARADLMRRVHATYPGFIDVSQSADTGEKVGMTKQMACTASVCGASSSVIIKKILLEDPDIILLDDVEPESITADKLAKVFVNGDWLGCCRKSHDLVYKYRVKRRHGDINYLTTIVWEPLIREVHFWTDVGRLVRPLVIVYNNLAEYIARVRAGDRKFQFKQWIKLTKNHILGLQTGTLTMSDLRAERVIEYISPEEQESAFLSQNINVLRERVNNVQWKYTHCDIDQAIFGIVTLAAPMANHSNAVRNTMYTNHRKQSAGWYALNYPFRIDKNVTLQHYCEKPLVSVFSDALTYPNGQNTVVALMLHRGLNQEDSIDVNQSSIDCGMFNASHYNYEKTELEKDEDFGNPDITRTKDIRKGAIYEFIEKGVIAEGTLAKQGYVLIVKTAKIPKPSDQYLYVDKSIIYKHKEPVIIERVVVTHSEDSVIAKVKWRSDRPLTIGDKLSSRTGNKGICASKIPRNDMPYCEDGTVPDLIVNAHSIPTRMAVNQIRECVIASVALQMGAFIDATPFKDLDIDEALKILESKGIKYGGTKRMWNGRTGCWIDTLIFVGITVYQRLQKFVVDDMYAVRAGPTSALTRQPLDGKNNDGGLRLGEMEKDVFCAHGTMRALAEKFYKDSDGINMPICRMCMHIAVVSEKKGIYRCKYCGDGADIVSVSSSWVANLFSKELGAMNCKMLFELAPFTYTRMQGENE